MSLKQIQRCENVEEVLLYRQQTFRCGPSFRESVKDDEPSGRSSTLKTDENVYKTVLMDYNRVVCIMTSCQKVRQLTSSFIWELWDVCVKQFAKKDRICGNHVTPGRYPQLFDQEQKEYHPTATEFDWFGFLRLHPVQSTQKIAPGNTF